MNNINCSKCGGDHWGTPIGWCPFHDKPLPDTSGWPKPGRDLDKLISEARFAAKKMRDDSADGKTVRVPVNVARILENCVLALTTTPRDDLIEALMQIANAKLFAGDCFDDLVSIAKNALSPPRAKASAPEREGER